MHSQQQINVNSNAQLNNNNNNNNLLAGQRGQFDLEANDMMSVNNPGIGMGAQVNYMHPGKLPYNMYLF